MQAIKSFRTAVLGLAALLGLAACGGGAGSSGASATPGVTSTCSSRPGAAACMSLSRMRMGTS